MAHGLACESGLDLAVVKGFGDIPLSGVDKGACEEGTGGCRTTLVISDAFGGMAAMTGAMRSLRRGDFGGTAGGTSVMSLLGDTAFAEGELSSGLKVVWGRRGSIVSASSSGIRIDEARLMDLPPGVSLEASSSLRGDGFRSLDFGPGVKSATGLRLLRGRNSSCLFEVGTLLDLS